MKLIPYKKTRENKYFIRENGKTFITSVGLAVAAIMAADVIFAVDSIPAVIAISSDQNIVLTSNILAVLGLRAMYFVLLELNGRFWALGYGLGIILIFISLKMLLIDVIKIEPGMSLIVIAGILMGSIIYSSKTTKKEELCIKENSMRSRNEHAMKA